MQNYIASPYIREDTLETYIQTAVNRLQGYIRKICEFNTFYINSIVEILAGLNDKQCEIRDNQQPQITIDKTASPNMDLYLVIDPTWMYEDALLTLA